MKMRDLFGLTNASETTRKGPLGLFQSERMPRSPRVVRWAWAGAVTTGIVMALSSGQAVSREEVLQLLKAVTALVEEERPTPAKDQPAPPEQQGPSLYVPDPKWGR
jgi:hypothetical protein